MISNPILTVQAVYYFSKTMYKIVTKCATELKRTDSLLNILAITKGILFRLTILKLRNSFKETPVL